ncbi:uncharacterized protein LOC143023427 isoform X2 [Oratosquilla oratoria]|uniref:uncharacterized protein LOC143023427 isoform X2 n=1 Tax=Oratosquilla oratoria TaxID=337810 RepID=UPI003F758EDD
MVTGNGGACRHHRLTLSRLPAHLLYVENSPAIYIPFLNKESVGRHRALLSKGHTFLPLEIEESYLNNGTFTFNQGKSCLFTIRLQSDTVSDNRYKAKVSISVLNGFTMPIQIFGMCRVALSLPTVQDSSHKSALVGKLLLLDERHETVAHMCVSLTLSLLGHELVKHTSVTRQGPDQDIKTSTSILPRSQNKEVQAGSGNLYNEQDVALLQMRLEQRQNLLSNEVTKIKEDEDVSHEQEDITPIAYAQNDKDLINTENTEDESEELSSECSSYVSDMLITENKESKNVHLSHLNENIKNLLSLKYRGPNAESGKIWEEKVKRLYENEYEDRYESTDKTSFTEESKDISRHEHNIRRKSNHRYSKSKGQPHHYLQKKHKEENGRHLTEDRREMTRKSRRQSWTYWPNKGWIRVTPVRKMVHNGNHIPAIKGTRTTLLRQCCVDQNLAKELQLEVDRRMKEKLLLLDSQFKDLKAASRKFRKKRKGTTDVGSQTIQKESSDQTDFSQQTENCKPVTTEHWTSIGDSLKLSDESWKTSPVPTPKIEKKRENRINDTKRRNKERLQNTRRSQHESLSNLHSSSPSISQTENSVLRKGSIPDNRYVTSKTERCSEPDYVSSESSELKISNTPVTNKTRHELMQQQSRDSSETRNQSQPPSRGQKEDDTNRKTTESSESVYRKLIAPAVDSKQNSDTSISSDLDRGVSDRSLQRGDKMYVRNIDPEEDKRKELHDWTGAKAIKHQEIISSDKMSSLHEGISETSEIEEEPSLDYQESFSHESDEILVSDSVAEEVDDYSFASKADSGQKVSSPDVSTEGREESEKKFGQTFVLGSTVEGSGTYNSGEPFISIGQLDSAIDSPKRGKLDWKSKDQEKQNYKFGRTFTLEEETKTGETSDSKLYPKSTKSLKTQNSSGLPTTHEVARLSTESAEDIQMATFVKSRPEVNTSPRAIEDIDSSISDISARIAQLLMRKSQEKITSIHTDSVSSYVPSSFIDETLSSLSDI